MKIAINYWPTGGRTARVGVRIRTEIFVVFLFAEEGVISVARSCILLELIALRSCRALLLLVGVRSNTNPRPKRI